MEDRTSDGTSAAGPTAGAAPESTDFFTRRPALLRARLAAAAIDAVVILAAAAAVPQPFPPVVVLGIFVLYHGTLTWWTGRTLGKAVVGLRVLRPDRRIPAWWAFARAGPGYLVLGLGGLGLLTAFVDEGRRALYDIALGGAVVQHTSAVRRPRGLLDRLVEYAEEHQRAAAERKKTFAVLLAFWVWLAGLGKGIRKVFDWLRGSQSTSGSSALSEVSSAVAAAVGIAATGVATAVVTVVPLTQPVGEWLVTDRYWSSAGKVELASLSGQWTSVIPEFGFHGSPIYDSGIGADDSLILAAPGVGGDEGPVSFCPIEITVRPDDRADAQDLAGRDVTAAWRGTRVVCAGPERSSGAVFVGVTPDDRLLICDPDDECLELQRSEPGPGSDGD